MTSIAILHSKWTTSPEQIRTEETAACEVLIYYLKWLMFGCTSATKKKEEETVAAEAAAITTEMTAVVAVKFHLAGKWCKEEDAVN